MTIIYNCGFFAENECATANGGCDHMCQNTPSSYTCSCRDGYTLDEDNHSCIDIDECSTSVHGCQQVCTNTEGSYSCECRDGYALDDNGKTCSISCGGRLLDSSGSFQTPDWPDKYPQADFICEWTIDMSANSSIQFTVDSSAYGINGRPPCQNDHLEFFDGMESDSRSLGRFCKLEVPPPITTSTGAARVVFEGREHQNRPASRKGVRVMYNVST
ncbi:Tolloid-like protein 2 [Geodia barretti]|uniref:Tolloid-like protein 2 n=1 Tax=Geodia barretti TaxID=519541 RepID=A0AA35R9Y2_GEOBA|nr:Tolloid-like protein 2 [Geodia barretti]